MWGYICCLGENKATFFVGCRGVGGDSLAVIATCLMHHGTSHSLFSFALFDFVVASRCRRTPLAPSLASSDVRRASTPTWTATTSTWCVRVTLFCSCDVPQHGLSTTLCAHVRVTVFTQHGTGAWVCCLNTRNSVAHISARRLPAARSLLQICGESFCITKAIKLSQKKSEIIEEHSHVSKGFEKENALQYINDFVFFRNANY